DGDVAVVAVGEGGPHGVGQVGDVAQRRAQLDDVGGQPGQRRYVVTDELGDLVPRERGVVDPEVVDRGPQERVGVERASDVPGRRRTSGEQVGGGDRRARRGHRDAVEVGGELLGGGVERGRQRHPLLGGQRGVAGEEVLPAAARRRDRRPQ